MEDAPPQIAPTRRPPPPDAPPPAPARHPPPPDAPPTAPARRSLLQKHAALAGLVAGFLLGMSDYLTLTALGVRMGIDGRDVTLAVVTLFAVNFAGLGYVIGRLLEARGRLRHSTTVIQRQLEALEASQQRVLQSEKLAAIGQLAAGVAHEVRNPLGVIRASASMLLDDLPADSDAHRASLFIREEVDRLNAVVTGLLNYSRPLTPRFGTVSLLEVAVTAHQLAEEEARSRGAVVSLETPGELEPAHGDPDLLTQVVLGLLINALQATDAGGRIALRFGRMGALPWLEVADDGPGVPEDLSARVFEPFFTTRPDGTGLGLAMAARIAEAQGGSLEVLQGAGTGEGGRGACFRLRLLPARAEQTHECSAGAA